MSACVQLCQICMRVCMCVRARVHKIYDGTWATHIYTYYIHIFVRVYLSLSVSLCDCLRVSYHVHLFYHVIHVQYPSFVFSSSSLRCRLVSCCTNPLLVRQLLWLMSFYYVSFRSPLCYHESKLAHTENQTSVHQRKHMSVHKVLWLPLAIRNAEQGLVANLDKNSARV